MQLSGNQKLLGLIEAAVSKLSLSNAKNLIAIAVPQIVLEGFIFIALITFIIFLLDKSTNSETQNDLLNLMITFGLALYRAQPGIRSVYQAFSALQVGKPLVNNVYAFILDPGLCDQQRENASNIEQITLSDVVLFAESAGKAVPKTLNLSIRKGQRVLITGPSGSGKTSLIHVISGLRTAFSGHIHATSLDAKVKRLKKFEDWLCTTGHILQRWFSF